MNLTTVCLMGSLLTAENHRELLEMVQHKSKRQVEELVAGLRPQPPIPASVRRLPTVRQAAASIPPNSTASLHPAIEGQSGPPMEIDTATPSGPSSASASPDLTFSGRTASRACPAVVTPLAPQRYKVQFTASGETVEKLRLAQALLRHQIPDGDPAAIVDRALTVLLETLAKQKIATTARQRESRGPAAGSRHIPSAVRRAVWLRDGARCAFVSRTGRRCTEGGFLEFHHVAPHAAGGDSTVENIQLRCRAHNGHEADLYFGPGYQRRVREKRPPHL